MKFTYEDSQFEIEFRRTYKEIPQINKETGEETAIRSKFPYTTVKIIKLVPDVLPPVIFRSYTVGAHHKESFSLERGRKAALRMLCRGTSLPPGFKKAMWDAYHSRKGAKS